MKRADVAKRAKILDERLDGFPVLGDPAAYHRWWELPDQWRAETFVAAATRRGIALLPAAAFAVRPGHAPDAVRIAVSATTGGGPGDGAGRAGRAGGGDPGGRARRVGSGSVRSG